MLGALQLLHLHFQFLAVKLELLLVFYVASHARLVLLQTLLQLHVLALLHVPRVRLVQRLRLLRSLARQLQHLLNDHDQLLV